MLVVASHKAYVRSHGTHTINDTVTSWWHALVDGARVDLFPRPLLPQDEAACRTVHDGHPGSSGNDCRRDMRRASSHISAEDDIMATNSPRWHECRR